MRFQTRWLAAGVASGLDTRALVPTSVSATSVMTSRSESNGRVRSAVAQHLSLVWRIARRAGLSREDAEDAAQHAFLILSQRLADVPPAAEASFLVATVLRVAKDLRRRKWNTCVEHGLEADARPGSVASPEDEVDRRRASSLLQTELDALDEPERFAFILVEIEQLSRSEAAAILRVPEGTVASRVRAARARLELAFARAFEDSRGRP